MKALCLVVIDKKILKTYFLTRMQQIGTILKTLSIFLYNKI